MHAKSDSEATSIDAAALSWPPRSPPRSTTRPLYYVQSPSNHDVDKMSYRSSPMGSPTHPHFYHCSPIHHSRESSTSRFSDRALFSYKSIREGTGRGRHINNSSIDEETNGGGGDDDDPFRNVRLYVWLLLSLVFLFTIFCLILWGTSKSYPPKIVVKGMVMRDFNIQAGNDLSGVPTDMLSLNSTVRILYRNPSAFFAVHVTVSPILLHYSNLLLASSEMKKFTVASKHLDNSVTVVHGHQIPLYGGVSVHLDTISLPLKLTLFIRTKAYILGRLVTSKFHTRVICNFTLNANHFPRPISFLHSCDYHHHY